MAAIPPSAMLSKRPGFRPSFAGDCATTSDMVQLQYYAGTTTPESTQSNFDASTSPPNNREKRKTD